MTADLFTTSALIDNNVGHWVLLEIQRYGSEKIEKIKGIVRSAFSNDPTPECKIETAEGKTEEIFMGEVREAELVA